VDTILSNLFALINAIPSQIKQQANPSMLQI